MGILRWDKPKKARGKDQWAEHAGFDGGPTGGYVPNMSDDDAKAWKAKITGTNLGFPQVEIRKQASSLMTIVVNLGGGYNYKYKSTKIDWDDAKRAPKSRHHFSGNEDHYALFNDPVEDGVNVQISMNGPSMFSFSDMEDMSAAIAEAKATLESLEEVIGQRYRYFAQVSPDDMENMVEKIKKIKGVRVYYELPIIGYIAFSASVTVVLEVVETPGVIAVKTHEAAKLETKKVLGYDRWG